MENTCQVYDSHVWIGNWRFLISNPDSAKDSLCSPKHSTAPCITPLQYRVCGEQQGNTALCLGQAQPRGLIWVPRNWVHCFENCSHFLSHLRINQSYTFAVYKKNFLPCMLFPQDLSEMWVPEAALSQPIHTGASPQAWAWKSSSLFLFSKDSNRHVTAPGPEKEEATGLIHLPNTATKT